MKTIPRRCGASLPDEDVTEGWHYCYHPAGHKGMHEDETNMWSDGEVVDVHTVQQIRAVPDHPHEFVGDTDLCRSGFGCQLAYGEYVSWQKWWREQCEDECSFCGHAEHCHTTTLPEEGRRAYCTECKGANEYHAFDDEPKTPEKPPQAVLDALSAWAGPQVSRREIEAVLAALKAREGKGSGE